jgi:hypothetical protein
MEASMWQTRFGFLFKAPFLGQELPNSGFQIFMALFEIDGHFLVKKQELSNPSFLVWFSKSSTCLISPLMDLASQFIYSAITGCNVFCFLQVKHD